ncbi:MULTISPECIES: NADP-dependent phosphogluconate dehydrogenase [Sphingosinicellaceae]|uniref:NADP-dependent phosphogluconate dehydrogenase n=1 Tax=Sphingosinicellaceae TaxID=2820280 RepID=UPI001C1E55C9|nr:MULTISPECIES: NADP-dependent phosphogluconate dehydrogenase [Polymorphobacter]QYE35663.1 NADP-dependent phosphogluconate dehydrogenase [Polymorphobacter sp. PAMC 29334]UAJ10971.1 NADP-dependent phosphogluconate dehydrogenase [Polymorphobacter megasporae]
MRLAMIGQGRLAVDITGRLIEAGHEVVVFNPGVQGVDAVAIEGAAAARSLDDLLASLEPPRILWIMLAPGEPTEVAIADLVELGSPGDVVVDGSDTFYKDDIRRAASCSARGIHLLDVGIMDGHSGSRRGYCMAIGGDAASVKLLDPIFDALAPGAGDIAPTRSRLGSDDRAERGYVHAGPTGAGRFVKMVHDAVGFGLMQAYAEGFDILQGRGSAKLPDESRFQFNLADIAEVWRRASATSSRLLDLTASALAEQGDLNRFNGRVSDPGEGHRTIEAAMEETVPAHVLSAALFARYRSRVDATFGDKVLSATLFGLSGHWTLEP